MSKRTCTQTIIEMVAAKLGNPVYNPPSKRAIGEVLDLSHTRVGQLRAGSEAMSRETFNRAAAFLELQPDEYLHMSSALDLERFEAGLPVERRTKESAEAEERVKAYIINMAKRWGSKVAAIVAVLLICGFGHSSVSCANVSSHKSLNLSDIL